jgi:hypothetical protein
MSDTRVTDLDAVHGRLTIDRRRPGVVLVTFVGTDVGQFGDAPFRALEDHVAASPVDLFIDARGAKGASIDVSGAWARWIGAHRDRLNAVHMLTGTRFIQLSADFVRRFAGVEDRMRLYAEPVAFEEALADARRAG